MMTNNPPLPDALKPCPFCGAKAEVTPYMQDDKTYHQISCSECECIAPHTDPEEGGIGANINKWNTRAALQSPTPEWQPIETAPRDGTEILVFASNRPAGKECTVAFWKKNGWAFLDNIFGTLYLDDDLTHWMPLPAAPKPDAEETK